MIKGISHILNIVFMALAIYFSINTAYGLFRIDSTDPRPSQPAIKSATSSAIKQRHPLQFYQPIVVRNLFHTKDEAPPETTDKSKDLELENLEKTELRLKLWGTVAARGNESYAVIELEKERKQNLYRVGDSIETAVLKLILREKVILAVDGKNEILEIEQPVNTKPPLRATMTSRRDALVKSSRPISKRRITLRRSQIESAMNNIGQLMGEAKIDPHLSDGRPDGLLISNVKPNSLFRRMGLRNGDIISGVDGRPIQSVDDALRLYENLKTSDSSSVEILRRGRKQAIEYRIR